MFTMWSWSVNGKEKYNLDQSAKQVNKYVIDQTLFNYSKSVIRGR